MRRSAPGYARDSRPCARFLRGSRRCDGGFTLLEILIALGVLAIGLTAVLGLLTAAVTAGKRAQDQVNAALLAESIIADIEHDIDLSFDHDGLDSLDPGSGDAYRTRILAPESDSISYPGYKTRVLITPLTGPADLPDEFLLEVEVSWSDRGQRRRVIYPASVLRLTSARDRPPPPKRAIGSGGAG